MLRQRDCQKTTENLRETGRIHTIQPFRIHFDDFGFYYENIRKGSKE